MLTLFRRPLARRYFFGGGVRSDSWWNTAVHLPFFFVQTVDAHDGLGMG
jgi:hypothetical protein